MSELLQGLNPVQQEAVLHRGGPLLLLAGAGSGKTRVITRRVAHLLQSGEAPESIVALTFTNKAAREMRARIDELAGAASSRLTVSTFHAFGARFLRRHGRAFGRNAGFSLYDEDDQLTLLEAAMGQEGYPTDRVLVRAVRQSLEQAKNAGLPASEARPVLTPVVVDCGRVGERYERLLERANAFDFGDLIEKPARILLEDEALKAKLQAELRWLLVDEFQDTNGAQLAWLRQLCPPAGELCVVGDDDQSIYGWRGARVENILEFSRFFPTVRVLKLEQNYRSTGYILEAANAVIAHNKGRLGKELWTEGEKGARVEVHESKDGREEGRFVAARVASLVRDECFDPSDIAILLRTSHLSLDIEEALAFQRQRYTMVRGRSFYDRAEVQDALAYVRLLVNPADDVAFLRALKTPSRGVGDKSLKALATWAHDKEQPIAVAVREAIERGLAVPLRGKAFLGLSQFMDALAFTPAEFPARHAAVVRGVLERAGLLEANRLRLGEDERQRQENVDRLVEALATYEAETEGATLAGFLEQAKLVSETDLNDAGQSVSLMTVHAAKGLEYPVVFVVGLEDGLFPHSRALEDEEVEEERRLMYVALTRARQRLILSYARERRASFGNQKSQRPSRFLAELPGKAVEARLQPEPVQRRIGRPSYDDCVDPVYDDDSGAACYYRAGMKVYHAQFGVGVVKSVSHGLKVTLTIDFPDLGTRSIVASYVSPYEG